VTVGCNLKHIGLEPPYVTIDKKKSLDEQFDSTLVLVETDYFSVNYADVCIRWGLYESALRFVGNETNSRKNRISNQIIVIVIMLRRLSYCSWI
jgi:hypothetical protein